MWWKCVSFSFQEEEGMRGFYLSRGLGDVYKGRVYIVIVCGVWCVVFGVYCDGVWGMVDVLCYMLYVI